VDTAQVLGRGGEVVEPPESERCDQMQHGLESRLAVQKGTRVVLIAQLVNRGLDRLRNLFPFAVPHVSEQLVDVTELDAVER
jgi:hypothetical protein